MALFTSGVYYGVGIYYHGHLDPIGNSRIISTMRVHISRLSFIIGCKLSNLENFFCQQVSFIFLTN